MGKFNQINTGANSSNTVNTTQNKKVNALIASVFAGMMAFTTPANANFQNTPEAVAQCDIDGNGKINQKADWDRTEEGKNIIRNENDCLSKVIDKQAQQRIAVLDKDIADGKQRIAVLDKDISVLDKDISVLDKDIADGKQRIADGKQRIEQKRQALISRANSGN